MAKKQASSHIKYIFVPMIISGAIRKQVIPRIEQVIRAEIEKNTDYYVLLEDHTFTVLGDDIEYTIKKRSDFITYKIRLMYTILNQQALYKLLKHDIGQDTRSKVRKFLSKLLTIAYRKYAKIFKIESDVVSVLWSDDNAIVVFDKSDLDKAEIEVPLQAKVAKKLQKVYGWPNIVVYDDFERNLVYFSKNKPGVKKIIRL